MLIAWEAKAKDSKASTSLTQRIKARKEASQMVFFFLLQLEGDSPLGVSFLFFVKEWGYRVRFEFSGYFVLGVLVFLWSMSIFFLEGGERGRGLIDC